MSTWDVDDFGPLNTTKLVEFSDLLRAIQRINSSRTDSAKWTHRLEARLEKDMSRTPNATIRTVDMRVLDKVFGMEGGYVLDFSNRTFAEFFREELRVEIYDSSWAVQGESKAKRLRYFLRKANRKTVLDTLNALWEYRQASSMTHECPELDDRVLAAFFCIIERFGGTVPASEVSSTAPTQSRIDRATAFSLAKRLLNVSKLNPRPRGYAFEKFLKEMFDAYGLSARASFRLVGEQIDGSFVLRGDTYLLEAKWTNNPVDLTTLRAFNAKVEAKASWSRGLLISYSGFSSGGLRAFGSGHSVICMDGRDLHAVLSRRLDFEAVLGMKARLAAETGKPLVRVDNFPPLSDP